MVTLSRADVRTFFTMSDLRVMPEIDQVVVKPGPLGLFLSQNVHDDGLLPSVMKSLGTESMRGRVNEGQSKSFFSSPCLCASVAIFFHGKEHEGKDFLSCS